MKYRKRPLVVEAEQWFPGKHVSGVRFHYHCGPPNSLYGVGPYVKTIQGKDIDIRPGEWVIQEGDGLHAYPCDPTVFERIYEPVTE